MSFLPRTVRVSKLDKESVREVDHVAELVRYEPWIIRFPLPFLWRIALHTSVFIKWVRSVPYSRSKFGS